MNTPQVKYPITLRHASELTGVSVSTLSDVARRIKVGRTLDKARVRLLSRRDLEKILAAKHDSCGRPKQKRND